MNGYPKSFNFSLKTVFSMLWLSGVLLIPSCLMFRLEFDWEWLMDLSISSGQTRHILTVLHAMLGWSLLWFLGALFTIHIRNHWRRRENAFNGIVFLSAWILLIASALGIYYLGVDWSNRLSAIIHTALGLLMPLLLILHISKGRKAVNS